MSYTRKTVDTWQLHVNYGHGWEHECTDDRRTDALDNLRLYRENCRYPVRLVKHREPKELHP